VPIFVLWVVMKANLALEAVIGPALTGLGYEFVGLEHLSYGKHTTLRIYIDCPGGVKIDDCEKVSRQLEAVLDVEAEDLLRGEYNLEVSSPGVDRKLFKIEQFARFIGKRLRIAMRVPVDGRRNFEGKLTAVADQLVSLEVDGSAINLDFANVAQANVVDDRAR
jgi:ribosome maturation factor RimP